MICFASTNMVVLRSIYCVCVTAILVQSLNINIHAPESLNWEPEKVLSKLLFQLPKAIVESSGQTTAPFKIIDRHLSNDTATFIVANDANKFYRVRIRKRTVVDKDQTDTTNSSSQEADTRHYDDNDNYEDDHNENMFTSSFLINRDDANNQKAGSVRIVAKRIDPRPFARSLGETYIEPDNTNICDSLNISHDLVWMAAKKYLGLDLDRKEDLDKLRTVLALFQERLENEHEEISLKNQEKTRKNNVGIKYSGKIIYDVNSEEQSTDEPNYDYEDDDEAEDSDIKNTIEQTNDSTEPNESPNDTNEPDLFSGDQQSIITIEPFSYGNQENLPDVLNSEKVYQKTNIKIDSKPDKQNNKVTGKIYISYTQDVNLGEENETGSEAMQDIDSDDDPELEPRVKDNGDTNSQFDGNFQYQDNFSDSESDNSDHENETKIIKSNAVQKNSINLESLLDEEYENKTNTQGSDSNTQKTVGLIESYDIYNVPYDAESFSDGKNEYSYGFSGKISDTEAVTNNQEDGNNKLKLSNDDIHDIDDSEHQWNDSESNFTDQKDDVGLLSVFHLSDSKGQNNFGSKLKITEVGLKKGDQKNEPVDHKNEITENTQSGHEDGDSNAVTRKWNEDISDDHDQAYNYLIADSSDKDTKIYSTNYKDSMKLKQDLNSIWDNIDYKTNIPHLNGGNTKDKDGYWRTQQNVRHPNVIRTNEDIFLIEPGHNIDDILLNDSKMKGSSRVYPNFKPGNDLNYHPFFLNHKHQDIGNSYTFSTDQTAQRYRHLNLNPHNQIKDPHYIMIGRFPYEKDITAAEINNVDGQGYKLTGGIANQEEKYFHKITKSNTNAPAEGLDGDLSLKNSDSPNEPGKYITEITKYMSRSNDLGYIQDLNQKNDINQYITANQNNPELLKGFYQQLRTINDERFNNKDSYKLPHEPVIQKLHWPYPSFEKIVPRKAKKIQPETVESNAMTKQISDSLDETDMTDEHLECNTGTISNHDVINPLNVRKSNPNLKRNFRRSLNMPDIFNIDWALQFMTSLYNEMSLEPGSVLSKTVYNQHRAKDRLKDVDETFVTENGRRNAANDDEVYTKLNDRPIELNFTGLLNIGSSEDDKYFKVLEDKDHRNINEDSHDVENEAREIQDSPGNIFCVGCFLKLYAN